jgi:hypothetical protein
LRSVSDDTPILAATDSIAAHCDEWPGSASPPSPAAPARTY